MAPELCSRNRTPFLIFAAPDEGAWDAGLSFPGSSRGRLPESMRESRWGALPASPGGAESRKAHIHPPIRSQELQGQAGMRRCCGSRGLADSSWAGAGVCPSG